MPDCKEEEKKPAIAKDTGVDDAIATGTVAPAAVWTAEEEARLVRKLDLRIFPMLIVLFLLNFIDRNNFANARLKGLEADLHLTDVQYDTCISILLVGYVSMELPSNILLHRLSRPSLYLSTCVLLWGLVSACTAAARSATGAILCRFFLGCLESALFPGTLYYLSRWYTRREIGVRITLVNVGNLAAQGFGGLIAAGVLGGMEGVAGVRGWRWLFIVEGCLTVVLAVAAWPVLPDWPGSTGWLGERERVVAMARLSEDVGVADDDGEGEGVFHGLRLAVVDPKVWLLAFGYLLTIMGLSFSYFFPTIAEALGYGTTVTLLLTAPPWIFAVLVALPAAWYSDRAGERYLSFVVPAIVCITGYIISMSTVNIGARYFAMFLMTTGYICGFVMLAWVAPTITRPPSKRAAAVAIVNACGNIGTIPATYVWKAEYGPYYEVPFGFCLAILGGAVVVATALRFYLRRLNGRLERDEGKAFEVSRTAVEHSASLGGGRVEDVRRHVKGFRYLY